MFAWLQPIQTPGTVVPGVWLVLAGSDGLIAV